MSAGIQPHLSCERSRRRNAARPYNKSQVQETAMRANWLLIVPLVTFGYICEAPAQVADLAGVQPGDRWVYELTDEITGDLKGTTTIVVLDVSEKEINTRWSARGTAGARQVAFDRNWSKIDDAVWKYTPSDGSGIKLPLRVEIGRAH